MRNEIFIYEDAKDASTEEVNIAFGRALKQVPKSFRIQSIINTRLKGKKGKDFIRVMLAVELL